MELQNKTTIITLSVQFIFSKLLIVTGTPQIPYYFYGLSHNLTYAPAALLVYEILQNCFSYLDSVPGMAGIEMEAFTDPEIETILRNNVARLK